MRLFRGFAAAAAVVLALGPAAQAQVNEQTAEEIRRAIKVWIGQNVQSPTTPYAVELDGQITVVPDGGLYRVTLPGGRAVVPGEGTFHFGEIAIDLSPLDNGWYDARWRIPDSYRLEPVYGSPALITIGGQSGTGVFAPEFQTMTSMDAELSDITASAVDEDARLTIDRIAVAIESVEVTSGVYDQVSTANVDSVRFTENGGRNRFELSDLEISVVSDDGRLAELAQFQRESNALTLQMEGANDIDEIGAATAAIADLMESMPALLAGVEMETRIGAVTIEDHGDAFRMDGGHLTMALTGLDAARSEFALGLGSDGISISDPDLDRLFPNEAALRLALTELPNSELVELGIGTMRSMGTTDPTMAMLMASGGLQQALTTANSTVEIGPIRIASDIASIDLEGVLRPDATSPFGVVGEADMVATGLDTMIAELQATGGDPELIQVLTLMQTLGAQAPDADGRTVRTYAFQLDSTGTVLLNGADIMPLLGMQ